MPFFPFKPIRGKCPEYAKKISYFIEKELQISRNRVFIDFTDLDRGLFALNGMTFPYLLCTSDCESMSLGELLALDPGAWDRFSALRLGYTESLGHPELRKSIAGLYDHI